MLDTRFPRFRGDIGNPDSFDFPVQIKVIKDAFPATVVRDTPEHCLPAFIKAARELEAAGAKLITTSCGFLTLFQKELSGAVSVPVLTSSLFLFNEISERLPKDKQLGILTIAASSLSNRHLRAAGIPATAAIGTTEKGEEFTSAILGNRQRLDKQKAQAENVHAALALRKLHPDLGGILLECTNMPPYKEAIEEATGLQVFSILDGLNDLWRKV